MDMMNLYTVEKISCFLITEFSANDFIQVKKLCRSLRHLEVQKTTKVALSEIFSSPKSFFAPLLRCITDKSLSCGRFPHDEDGVNKWFYHPTDTKTRNQQVQEINVEKEAGTTWDDENLASMAKLNELKLCEEDKFEIFYHGTHHGVVENIIDRIDLGKGGRRNEFSDGGGFYVTKSLSEAKKWADHKSGGSSAVLVFRVDKVMLRDNKNIKCLDLTGIDKIKEWQRLVKICLSRHESYADNAEGYGFIEGPLVDYVASKNNDCHTPINGSHQLCVLTDDCASLFDKSLCAVVYFSS